MKAFTTLMALWTSLIFLPIHAEIQQVTVTWTAMECQDSCMKQLKQQFQKIKGVSEVGMSPGSASLTWKPSYPFSYSMIHTAIRAIGLKMLTTRLKATGYLQHNKDKFYLISKGDNTRIELVNPTHYNPSGQSSEFNLQARYLTPEMYQKLLEAENNKQLATISGPLFIPIRMIPDVVLIIDQISFSQEKKETQNQQSQPQQR